ncbi:unnamed protein product [Mytilus edulis]|uniref:Integrase catalytic domain-containing protein n=1 Tax=Mytilus edulis TaxID=6550 RepID=A0A8S3VPV9_MYTED|nr:unnamed protein product [Mytilus edulis]
MTHVTFKCIGGIKTFNKVPGTKVGEGALSKDIKTITEEETEEAHPDTSETLIQPEEQGAAAPVPKPKDTVTGGAGIEFGSKTKSNYTFNFVPNVTNVPPKLNYNFPTVSQPTTSTANYSNFPPLINSNPVVNHQPLVQAARMPNVISLTKFTEKQSAKQWWTLFMQWVLYHSMTEAATLAAFPFHKISKCVENQVILLEPVKQLENANLMAAKCLVKVKRGRAMFKLCNPTDTEIFVRYNTILATISDIDTSCIIPLEQNEVSVNNVETCREKAKFEKTPIDFDLSNSELNSEQKRQLQEFLKTQRDVFATNLKELGKSDRYAHKIETFESTPIKMPFYRQNPVMQKEIDRQVNELIEAGIVVESNSEYHSPVVLVKKGDGTFRFCCDYRKINLQTRPIFHPLPRLESVFDCLAESEAHIFSSFDLHSGYFQIQIDPETRHKTAFITRNGIYEWTRMPMETQVAFEKLKQALVTAPILVHAKMNKPFHVTADASNSAIGYYLSQLDETGREHVIAYGGRSLSKAERNWSTSDLECLAVLEAIREHRSYLTVEFTVFTDHKALQYLMQQKRVTGRLARWALELQEFNFKIVHKPGRQNVVADALSQVQFFYDNTPIISSIETNQVDETLNDLPAIGKLQKECPDIRDIYLYKEQNQLPKEDKRKRKVIATSEYYDLCNGVLYHWFQKRLRKVTKEERLIRQIVLPKVLRKDALRAFHDNEMDRGVPNENQEATEVAKVLFEQIFSRFGAPSKIVSDLGKQFTSNLIHALSEIFDIKQHFTSAYHPQTNSFCERNNRTLIQSLRAYCDKDQENWPAKLPEMRLPFDVAIEPKNNLQKNAKEYINEVIENLRITREIAKENVKIRQEKSKEYYDRKTAEPEFRLHDKVLLRLHRTPVGKSPKLIDKYEGPYYITKIGPNYTFRLRKCSDHKELKSVVNASRLKHYSNPRNHRAEKPGKGWKN